MKNDLIKVENISINIENDDYICISDIAKKKSTESRPADIIRNWLRNRYTLDFLTAWEHLYNPNFKVFESEHFRRQVGLLTFTPSVTEWVDKTNAIGIYSKRGKYGGTYAHKDIAFEFASSISPVFKLYLIKEFERLKEKEIKEYNLEWKVGRLLSKVNYLIHTDAIRNYIVPNLTDKQKKTIYSSEADIINVALFGTTASEFKKNNPNIEGNLRDNADLLHLVVLSNLESINSELIKMNLSQSDRLIKLNETAKKQIDLFTNNKSIENLKYIENKNVK